MDTKRAPSQRIGALLGVVILGFLVFMPGCAQGVGVQMHSVNIYVTQADSAGGSVLIFPVTATGNVAPSAIISGVNTRLDDPHRTAFDASGNIYVTSAYNSSVFIFPSSANGNVVPSTTISGVPTGLDYPNGIALDANGNIYVTNFGNFTPPSVTVYAAGASGNATATAIISGAATGLGNPHGVAVDANGNIYVANRGNSSVTVYAAGTNGNMAPSATISGAATGLSNPHGLALDANGNIYVANSSGGEGSGSVTVYAAGAKNNATPTATITGSSTLLSRPNGIALDAQGNIYVANNGTATVLIYAAGSKNNVAPTAMIGGSNTGFVDIHGVSVY
jgi:DNA-binding beta-propeller fold protein YncE